MNLRNLIAAAITAAAIMLPGATSARDINVRGQLTHKKTHEPLIFASVYDAVSGRLLTATDEEGRYSVTIDSEGTLEFSILGCDDLQVDVKGRLTIDAELLPSSIVLDEVVVQGKRITSNVITEPTDLDVKGNYLHVKTRVKVPREMFSSNVRLVIQPDVRNITRKQTMLLRPLVFDGRRFHITQNRMLDNNAAVDDPLWSYSQVKKTGRGTDDIITIIDSVYVDDPTEDFRCDLMMAMENYNRIIYRDTVTIARGVVNPLRFLDYALAGSPVVNKEFFPKPEMQLRDSKGDINLMFKVGRTNLDLDLGNNRSEVASLTSQLHAIEADPNSALKSFSIIGTASPEGNYDYNLRLANGRVNSAMEEIMSRLDPSTRSTVEVNVEGRVATWEALAEMMRADSLTAEAESVEKIIDRYPGNITRQGRAMTALPFYTSLIAKEYLPRMRRVSYEVVSSQYRLLTDSEIAELYASDPAKLSRYEFWRLYTTTPDTTARRAILERCFEVHPNFTVGATDLAAMRLADGHPDASLLERFIADPKRKIPDETRLNHALALLDAREFIRADSLTDLLPDTPLYHKAIIYSRALNGGYRDVMQEISADSPFNEVLLLLAIKANDQAWRKAKLLGNSAREEYVKAVAANRVDEYMAAINHLNNAFELDPSLREIARVDGDLIDLLEDL